ncbi:MAG: hypothetical protein R3F37_19570 [Candidatus Competibacteraceae bacterium]
MRVKGQMHGENTVTEARHRETLAALTRTRQWAHQKRLKQGSKVYARDLRLPCA